MMNLNELNELMERVNISQKIDQGIVDDSASTMIESITEDVVNQEILSMNDLENEVNQAMGINESVEKVTEVDTTEDVDTATKFQAATPVSQEEYTKKATAAQSEGQPDVDKINSSLTESCSKFDDFITDFVLESELSEDGVAIVECVMGAFNAIFENLTDVVGSTDYKNLKKLTDSAKDVVQGAISYHVKQEMNKFVATLDKSSDLNKEDVMEAIEPFLSKFIDMDQLDSLVADMIKDPTFSSVDEATLRATAQKLYKATRNKAILELLENLFGK